MRAELKIKKRYEKILKYIAFVLIFILTVTIGETFAYDGGPEAVLKQCVNRSISILNDPVYKDTSHNKYLQKILFHNCEPTFDFMAIARGVLGRNWRRFSPKQREEFSKYFSHLIAQIYFAKLDRNSLQDISIQYITTKILPPTRSGIERADVMSEVTHSGKKTPVIYRMLKRKQSSWKIYDIKIEGVSLVSNYREQYRNKFMESPGKIIQELKDKVKM